MSERVTSAITRSLPPQSGQMDSNTRSSLSIQFIGAVGAAG
jgi:hypothetical protein